MQSKLAVHRAAWLAGGTDLIHDDPPDFDAAFLGPQ